MINNQTKKTLIWINNPPLVGKRYNKLKFRSRSIITTKLWWWTKIRSQILNKYRRPQWDSLISTNSLLTFPFINQMSEAHFFRAPADLSTRMNFQVMGIIHHYILYNRINHRKNLILTLWININFQKWHQTSLNRSTFSKWERWAVWAPPGINTKFRYQKIILRS